MEVGSSTSTGTGWPKLLGTKVDPKSDSIVWACWFNDFTQTQTGYLRMDITSGSIIGSEDLNANSDIQAGFMNDIAVDPVDGIAYATDLYTGKVIKLEPQGSRYSDTVMATVVASDLLLGGPGLNGPNGIALLPNGEESATHAIVAMYSEYRAYSAINLVDLSDGSSKELTVTPSWFSIGNDGIIFDDEGEFLFVINNGAGSVSAYYSCDGFTETMTLARVFKCGCEGKPGNLTATTAAYRSNGDLLVSCVNGFTNVGPYEITVIPSIRSLILGESFDSASQLCSIGSPTASPTFSDLVIVSTTFEMSAEDEADLTEENIFPAVATTLDGVDESDLSNLKVTWTADASPLLRSKRSNDRRRLSGTAVVTFDITKSISETDSADAGSFVEQVASEISEAVTSGALSVEVAQNCGWSLTIDEN